MQRTAFSYLDTVNGAPCKQVTTAVVAVTGHSLPHELPCHALADAPRPVSPLWSSQGCFLGTPLNAVIPHSTMECACTKADHLSHMYFEFPSQPVELPAMKEVPSPANCHTTPWLLSFPRALFCMYGGWPPLLLVLPVPHETLLGELPAPGRSLNSSGVSALQEPPCICNTPLCCRMHPHQSWSPQWFSLLLNSQYSSLVVIGNTLHYSSYTESALPMTVIHEWSPCPHLNPWALSIVFLELYFIS